MAAKQDKKDTYSWEGTNKKGERVKGEMSGTSPALVKTELRRQGINPLKVKKKAASLFGSKPKGKILPKDIAIFTRQLAVMMSSGVPLVQSFDIMAKGTENGALAALIATVKTDLEGGLPMADAFRRHPQYFDDLTCNLIHAGEQAGILEDLLDKIATYKEKTEIIKGKIKKALTYPTAVVIVAFIITIILLIFVIPQFESLFSGFGANLPAPTQFVVDMSHFVLEWWWALFGFIFGFSYGFSTLNRRSKAFNEAVQRASLHAPIFGEILTKAAIARFARTLSTMFAAGVPLVEAMDSVSGAVGNIVFKNAVLKIRDDVATGTSVTQSMAETGIFPNMVVQMATIGEEAGSLDTMLGKVADFYEEEVDNAVDSLSSLMEPMIMAFLGVVVGGLVIAMYLPIFKMGEVVG